MILAIITRSSKDCVPRSSLILKIKRIYIFKMVVMVMKELLFIKLLKSVGIMILRRRLVLRLDLLLILIWCLLIRGIILVLISLCFIIFRLFVELFPYMGLSQQCIFVAFVCQKSSSCTVK